jgi:hypothetical protein
MNIEQNSLERLSMRKSMLVWMSGICLGWAIAFGLIFSYWAATRQEPVKDTDTGKPALVAQSTPKDLNDIKPASGKPAAK